MLDNFSLELLIVITTMLMVLVTAFVIIIRRLETRQKEQEGSRQNNEQRLSDNLYEQKRMLADLKNSLSDQAQRLDKSLVESTMDKSKDPIFGTSSGGYIIMDLPEQHISLFHDLLKGFEEYAKIKGYSAYFSVDRTTHNRIAFKFTLGDEGIGVSTDTISKDLKEYIERIQSGAPLDDLPVVLTPEEHDLLLTTMKNRINFLQHNYNLQKNAAEFYRRFLEQLPRIMPRLLSQPNIHIQAGGQIDSRAYSSVESVGVVQGDSSSIQGNVTGTSISIADSFNDRKSQIAEITKLIEIIRLKENVEEEEIESVLFNLTNVKNEMEEEESPDPSRIHKWLQKVKNWLGMAKIGGEVLDQASKVFEEFGLPFSG